MTLPVALLTGTATLTEPHSPMWKAQPARPEAHADAPTPAVFTIGDVVRHRVFPFRGVIFDVDPVFNNTEEWWQSIPEAIRPRKDQPFYHLFAENEESAYVAYVSQQNLLPDPDGDPVNHPGVIQMFAGREGGRYRLRREMKN